MSLWLFAFLCFSALKGKACISSWEACDGFNDCYSTSEYSVDEMPEICQELPTLECKENEVITHD